MGNWGRAFESAFCGITYPSQQQQQQQQQQTTERRSADPCDTAPESCGSESDDERPLVQYTTEDEDDEDFVAFEDPRLPLDQDWCEADDTGDGGTGDAIAEETQHALDEDEIEHLLLDLDADDDDDDDGFSYEDEAEGEHVTQRCAAAPANATEWDAFPRDRYIFPSLSLSVTALARAIAVCDEKASLSPREVNTPTGLNPQAAQSAVATDKIGSRERRAPARAISAPRGPATPSFFLRCVCARREMPLRFVRFSKCWVKFLFLKGPGEMEA